MESNDLRLRPKYEDWVFNERENIVKFLKQLIQTPRLSGEEKEISRVICDKMVELGYKVNIDAMGNVIGVIG